LQEHPKEITNVVGGVADRAMLGEAFGAIAALSG
jgi:hypothetical protein